jgi:NNP family nitrate/nitrite transporter-like MFS transporter
MFSREISGTANGIVAGWGNLGGAFTQLLMGRILFPAFENYYGSAERSWRTICVIPAAIAFTWGIILPFISDDAPMGNYNEMKKKGTMDRVFMTTALRKGASFNTVILYIQYAACFGVELIMNNGAVLYFIEEFGLNTETASVIGFIFGSMNIFARALGGLCSDQFNLSIGMRGRLWLLTALLVSEGVVILLFAVTTTLGGSIAAMCVFSLFVQAAEGAVFGIVPYVSKLYTGAVAGFVGSGGNMGSVVYGFGFRSLPYRKAFLMMGSIVVASSFLSFFLKIPMHAGMITGEDHPTVIQARERFKQRRALERQRREQTEPDGDDEAGQEEGQSEDGRAIELVDVQDVEAVEEMGEATDGKEHSHST